MIIKCNGVCATHFEGRAKKDSFNTSTYPQVLLKSAIKPPLPEDSSLKKKPISKVTDNKKKAILLYKKFLSLLICYFLIFNKNKFFKVLNVSILGILEIPFSLSLNRIGICFMSCPAALIK